LGESGDARLHALPHRVLGDLLTKAGGVVVRCYSRLVRTLRSATPYSSGVERRWHGGCTSDKWPRCPSNDTPKIPK
jgi:hypothetical protein